MTNSAQQCWYLSGPTASGKTQVGLLLAERIGGEIVSLDSMAVYRGMDVGTAKPTAEQRRRVPHHLIDLCDPAEQFSVSMYTERARQAIEEIAARGRQALFVGGTPLYLKAMLRGIFDGPPADWPFRRQVEREVDEVGVAALHERLKQVDPLAAAHLHPHDKRRIIRALEVYKATGRPISHQQTQFDEGHPAERCKVFVLSWPRPELHRRIDRRVDEMIADGLVDEVRSLLAHYGQLGRTARQAVGYRQVLQHLEGQYDLPTAIEVIKARTRQFARRQETWFRSLSECRFVRRGRNDDPAAIVEQIVAAGHGNADPG